MISSKVLFLRVALSDDSSINWGYRLDKGFNEILPGLSREYYSEIFADIFRAEMEGKVLLYVPLSPKNGKIIAVPWNNINIMYSS